MGDTIGETFGQRVARLRAAAELTQEGLAEKAGLPVPSLRNYEHDHRRPRADAALRLARALGVTLEELLAVPSSRPARADVQDPPGLRGLKRAWARAKGDERRQFLEFVAAAAEKFEIRSTDAGKGGRVGSENAAASHHAVDFPSRPSKPQKKNSKRRKPPGAGRGTK